MEDVYLNSSEDIRRHVRSLIQPADRGTLGVRFVLCDDTNRVLTHCHVTDISDHAGFDDCYQITSLVACVMSAGHDCGAVVAVTRPGSTILNKTDVQWFRAAHGSFHEHGVRLLGVHIITPGGQREIQVDDAI